MDAFDYKWRRRKKKLYTALRWMGYFVITWTFISLVWAYWREYIDFVTGAFYLYHCTIERHRMKTFMKIRKEAQSRLVCPQN